MLGPKCQSWAADVCVRTWANTTLHTWPYLAMTMNIPLCEREIGRGKRGVFAITVLSFYKTPTEENSLFAWFSRLVHTARWNAFIFTPLLKERSNVDVAVNTSSTCWCCRWRAVSEARSPKRFIKMNHHMIYAWHQPENITTNFKWRWL